MHFTCSICLRLRDYRFRYSRNHEQSLGAATHVKLLDAPAAVDGGEVGRQSVALVLGRLGEAARVVLALLVAIADPVPEGALRLGSVLEEP